MIVRRKRAGTVSAVFLVLLVFASCRSQSEPLTTETSSADSVVSSTPPFQTKEPERYRAVRTITTVNAAGDTLVTKTSVARDGELRRQESEAGSNTIVYLDVTAGRFVLLPGEKVYADLTNENKSSADKDEDELEGSPDALLHAAAGATTYQKMGADVIAGRNTNKYRILVNSSSRANVTQSETLMWIDEALQMPVKSETKSADGTRVTMEVSDINFEVDRSLFTVPADYQKVTFSDLQKHLTAPQKQPS